MINVGARNCARVSFERGRGKEAHAEAGGEGLRDGTNVRLGVVERKHDDCRGGVHRRALDDDVYHGLVLALADDRVACDPPDPPRD